MRLLALFYVASYLMLSDGKAISLPSNHGESVKDEENVVIQKAFRKSTRCRDGLASKIYFDKLKCSNYNLFKANLKSRKESISNRLDNINLPSESLFLKNKSSNPGLTPVQNKLLRRKRSFENSMNRQIKGKSLWLQPKSRQMSSSNDVMMYAYKFWGENFVLNGTIVIRQHNKRKLWILFECSKSGGGNVSIDVLNPSHASSLDTNKIPRLLKRSRPRNCHVQSDIKRIKQATKDATPCSRFSDQGNVEQEREKKQKKMSLPRSKSDMKCNVSLTEYKKTFLCLNPSISPCLLVSFQGETYKIAERICPNHLPYKSGIHQ